MNLRFWEKKEKSQIDVQIEAVLTSMTVYTPDSPEYKKLLKHLAQLQKLNANERVKKAVSPDTKWLVLGNLAGILIIVLYESKHVFTSKAGGYIKPKI